MRDYIEMEESELDLQAISQSTGATNDDAEVVMEQFLTGKRCPHPYFRILYT
jgi:hypothetical protein